MVSWGDNKPVPTSVIASGAVGPVGAEGTLELDAKRQGEQIQHVGQYRYHGPEEGMHKFESTDDGHIVFLHGHEIRSFQ